MEPDDNGESVFEIFDGGKCAGTATFSGHAPEAMDYAIARLYADGFSVRPQQEL